MSADKTKTLDPGFRRDDGGNVTVASTTTVIPAKGEAGVSDRMRSARATALACKPVRALQGGIQCLSSHSSKL